LRTGRGGENEGTKTNNPVVAGVPARVIKDSLVAAGDNGYKTRKGKRSAWFVGKSFGGKGVGGTGEGVEGREPMDSGPMKQAKKSGV